MNVAEARRQFPHTWTDMAYLNHAAVAPLSFPVREAVGKYMERRALKGIEPFPWAMEMANQTRKLIADLIHAKAEDIAFVMNTSDGLNIIASGIDWEAGDRILLNDLEFPSNAYPFVNLKNRGVIIDTLEAANWRVTPQALFDRLDPRTRLVAISFVQFLTGERADLVTIGEELHKRNILFVVDAIQGLPHMPLDVEAAHIDFLSSGSHKWLMGPEGMGFIYASPRARSLIRQASLGWKSVEDPFNFNLHPDELREGASRYENGTLNNASIAGLKASLEFFLEFGQEEAARHILDLTGFFIDRLLSRGVNVITPKDESQRAGIVTFEFDNADAMHKRLMEHDIVLSLRTGKLRVSPHFYNTEDEMRRVYLALFD
jgi:selenocysteine lyase/cysteine desulfurase